MCAHRILVRWGKKIAPIDQINVSSVLPYKFDDAPCAFTPALFQISLET